MLVAPFSVRLDPASVCHSPTTRALLLCPLRPLLSFGSRGRTIFAQAREAENFGGTARIAFSPDHL
jgi:hypothetical protein